MNKVATNIYKLILTIIAILLGLWGYFINQYFLLFLPLFLAFIFFDKNVLFGLNNSNDSNINAAILGSLIIYLTCFVLIPFINILNNNLSFSFNNIIEIYKESNFLIRLITITVILIIIYIGVGLVLAKFSSNRKMNNEFYNELKEIISYFKALSSTSKKTAILRPVIASDNAFNFLIKNKIIHEYKEEYYLDENEASKLDDFGGYRHVRNLIIIVVIVFIVFIFSLLSFNKKTVVDYTIKSEDFSFNYPSDYIFQENETSYVFISKDDNIDSSNKIVLTIYTFDYPTKLNHNSKMEKVKNDFSNKFNSLNFDVNEQINSKGLDVFSSKISINGQIKNLNYIYVENNELCYKVLLIESAYSDSDLYIEKDISDLVNSISYYQN